MIGPFMGLIFPSKFPDELFYKVIAISAVKLQALCVW